MERTDHSLPSNPLFHKNKSQISTNDWENLEPLVNNFQKKKGEEKGFIEFLNLYKHKKLEQCFVSLESFFADTRHLYNA